MNGFDAIPLRIPIACPPCMFAHQFHSLGFILAILSLGQRYKILHSSVCSLTQISQKPTCK